MMALLVGAAGSGAMRPATPKAQAVSKPPVNSVNIGTDDVLLKQYLKAYGPDQTITYIKTLPIDCHQRSHKVGRLNYELVGNKAFSVMNSDCMSGYTHGVTEAFFHDHGTKNLSQSLELICHGQQNSFYFHQCYHGVGHGLMAYEDYDLPAALKDCDQLPPNGTSDKSCYSGVFMENVIGAIPVEQAKASPNTGTYHATSWLSDDPLFPCNAVKKYYKSSCYSFQTSRMIVVLNYDYQKVADACGSIETDYRSICFSSMGRDAGNTYDTDYAAIEKSCDFVEDGVLRTSCINGASQNTFWHKTQQDSALALCRSFQEASSKLTCYSTLAERGADILPTVEENHAFCAKFEPDYKYMCGGKS